MAVYNGNDESIQKSSSLGGMVEDTDIATHLGSKAGSFSIYLQIDGVLHVNTTKFTQNH